MKHSYSGAATIHLTGDWTITGVVQQVPRLTGLEMRRTCRAGTVAVDCSGIAEIDLSGFQLLYVWLHCIQLHGLRPELVNMPVWMYEAQKRQGVAQVFENELMERWADDCSSRDAAMVVD